jgi:hypothetical protein
MAADPANYLAALQGANPHQLTLVMQAGDLISKRLRRGSGKFFDQALTWSRRLDEILLYGSSNVTREKEINDV